MRRLALAAVLLCACAREGGPVAAGTVVDLDYELSSDGAVIESSKERGEPLTIVSGEGGLPERVDRALLGLKPGEEKVVDLPPELGFGVKNLDLIESMPREAFGDLAKDLKPGAKVMGSRGGKAAEARVVALDAKFVLLDFNHPLAGKRLSYRLKVLSTRPR